MASEASFSPSRPDELDTVPASTADDDAGFVAQTWQAMATLTTSQRQILVLSYFEELTQPQIATRLGVPLAMVQVNASSAIERPASAIQSKAGMERRTSGAHHGAGSRHRP